MREKKSAEKAVQDINKYQQLTIEELRDEIELI
jgi:hypothetical protein